MGTSPPRPRRSHQAAAAGTTQPCCSAVRGILQHTPAQTAFERTKPNRTLKDWARGSCQLCQLQAETWQEAGLTKVLWPGRGSQDVPAKLGTSKSPRGTKVCKPTSASPTDFPCPRETQIQLPGADAAQCPARVPTGWARSLGQRGHASSMPSNRAMVPPACFQPQCSGSGARHRHVAEQPSDNQALLPDKSGSADPQETSHMGAMETEQPSLATSSNKT